MRLFSHESLIAHIDFPQIKDDQEEDRFSDAGTDLKYVGEVENYCGLLFTVDPETEKSKVALRRIAKARRQLERLYRKHLKRSQGRNR